MVWNSEQSPLYRTVESFNNSTCKPDEDPVERQCGEPKCGAAPEVGKCRSEQPRKCSPPPGNIGGILQKLTGEIFRRIEYNILNCNKGFDQSEYPGSPPPESGALVRALRKAPVKVRL